MTKIIKYPLFLFFGGILFASSFYIVYKAAQIFGLGEVPVPKIPNISMSFTKHESLPDPEISGWIAWWKEDSAYSLVASNSAKIKTVSPVWFMVSEDLALTNIGKVKRETVIKDLKNLNVEIYPTLGSEVGSKRLGVFLNDKEKSSVLIQDLVNNAVQLGAQGVDIDLEGIEEKDKGAFISFLADLKQTLEENHLKLTIAVHAQSENNTWDGVLGQDIEKIGKLVDEVRIMAYDQHSASTKAGAISELAWIEDVLDFNLDRVTGDKIVLGIPSYGYVWTADGKPKGLQFDEFNEFLEGKDYESERDKKSGELHFTGDGFEGYLSDSIAMQTKIEVARKMGINKFVIWHLGGLDEQLFSLDWKN